MYVCLHIKKRQYVTPPLMCCTDKICVAQTEYMFPGLNMQINIAKCEATDKRDCEGNFTHNCNSRGGKTWSHFNIHDDYLGHESII